MQRSIYDVPGMLVFALFLLRTPLFIAFTSQALFIFACVNATSRRFSAFLIMSALTTFASVVVLLAIMLFAPPKSPLSILAWTLHGPKVVFLVVGMVAPLVAWLVIRGSALSLVAATSVGIISLWLLIGYFLFH